MNRKMKKNNFDQIAYSICCKSKIYLASFNHDYPIIFSIVNLFIAFDNVKFMGMCIRKYL